MSDLLPLVEAVSWLTLVRGPAPVYLKGVMPVERWMLIIALSIGALALKTSDHRNPLTEFDSQDRGF